MHQLSGFPYARLAFDGEGALRKPYDGSDLLKYLRTSADTDLIVIAHGWRNDEQDAQQLFQAFLKSASEGMKHLGLSKLVRQTPVAGVCWPSMALPEHTAASDGAASMGGGEADQQLGAALQALAKNVSAEQRETIVALTGLLELIESDSGARRDFVSGLLSILTEDDESGEEGLEVLRSTEAEELFERLSAPILFPVEAGSQDQGGIAGVEEPSVEAAGLGALLAGIKGGAARLVNITTFYLMKERAGRVGMVGVYPYLGGLQAQFPHLRLHLIGHSFGGRLVSAAARGVEGGTPLLVSTITLLQAAFSHYGFSDNAAHKGSPGFFRPVVEVGRVKGPILITHTANDKAVGIAYAIASRLAGQNAAALGDASDEHGGIGRNGAQLTPEAVSGKLIEAGGIYQWAAGRLFNLRADDYIRGHSDVTGAQVGYAFASAFAFTRAT